MRCPWRSKYFAGETILQFHCLIIDDDLFCTRWRPICGAVADNGLNLNLSFNISSLIFCGPRQDAGITEAGLEEIWHDKDEENTRNHGNSGTHVHRQERAVEGEEQDAGQDDDEDTQVEKSGPLCHEYSAVAQEVVPAGEDFPFSRYPLHVPGHGGELCGGFLLKLAVS